jgi:hypothetical protein
MIEVESNGIFNNSILPPEMTEREQLNFWIWELNRRHDSVRKCLFAKLGIMQRQVDFLLKRKKRPKRFRDPKQSELF